MGFPGRPRCSVISSDRAGRETGRPLGPEEIVAIVEAQYGVSFRLIRNANLPPGHRLGDAQSQLELRRRQRLPQPGTGAVQADGRGLSAGFWDSHLREKVFPEFEKKHNVKIDYVAGNSTDTLAKLQAQKGNQVIDVAIMDDGVDVPGDPARLLHADPGHRPERALPGRAVQGRQGGRGRPDRHRLHNQRQLSVQGEGLGDADVVERSQGSQVQEAARHPADQQHLRPLHLDDVRPHERRRREEHRSRLQGDEGSRSIPTCWSTSRRRAR